MYQVLQVYTSFRFSLIISCPCLLKSSIVAETSPPRPGDVVTTFPQSFSVEQVAETSSKTYLAAATLPEPTGDLKKYRIGLA